jgi:hypothetical protein
MGTTKAQRIVRSLVQDILVYLSTLSGVLSAQFASLIHGEWNWARLGAAAIFAMILMLKLETDGDQVAKQARLKKRMAEAFSHGAMLDVGVGAAMDLLKIA